MKKETAIYPSLRKLLGTTLATAIMTALSCLLVIVQPHGKVGLVIGIVGAVFFGGCICILFIVLLKNFFRNKPPAADSGQSADLRTGKRDLPHDRMAAHCGFQRIPNLRAEIHPDRTPRSRPGDRRGEKPDCQRAYALANEAFRITLRNHGFNSRYRHDGTRKNPAGVFTGIPRKIRCELTDPARKRYSAPIPHIVGNTLAPSGNAPDQDMKRSMAGIYRLQTDFPNVIIHFTYTPLREHSGPNSLRKEDSGTEL